MEFSDVGKADQVLDLDALDKALHDCMNSIWKAYRTNNVKVYNNVFAELYREYSDPAVVAFIQSFGMGLAPAVNRRAQNGKN